MELNIPRSKALDQLTHITNEILSYKKRPEETLDEVSIGSVKPFQILDNTQETMKIFMNNG